MQTTPKIWPARIVFFSGYALFLLNLVSDRATHLGLQRGLLLINLGMTFLLWFRDLAPLRFLRSVRVQGVCVLVLALMTLWPLAQRGVYNETMLLAAVNALFGIGFCLPLAQVALPRR